MTPLERAKEMAAARLAETAAARPAPTTTSSSNATVGGVTQANAAAPVPFESLKLKTLADALEKRLDDFTMTLENTIADVEASVLDPRLSSWLAYAVERRRTRTVMLAVAGMKMRERVAASCAAMPAELESVPIAVVGDDAAGAFERIASVRLNLPTPREGLTGIAIVRPDLAVADSLLLGTLRRECAGFVWLGPKSALPPELAETFAESPLGVVTIMPTDPGLASYLAKAAPEGSLGALGAAIAARQLLDLAGGIQFEHGAENERLAAMAATAERMKNSRAFSSELGMRRDLMTQIRDNLARDVQGIVDELVKAIAQLDSEAMLRVPVRRALDEIPALSINHGRLVHVENFEIEQRHQWFTGSRWKRLSRMFPQKMRLTIPNDQLATLSANLTAQLTSMISKNASRRIEALNRALADFDVTAASLGVDLASAAINEDESVLFDKKADARTIRSMPSLTAGSSSAPLQERARRTIDSTCERDVKGLHIDIERKGPIGRLMEARTAVMGISFLVMTGIRLNTAIQSSTNHAAATTTATAGGVPWGLIFNASIIGVFMIFLGLAVNAVTDRGKEDAVVTEKVVDARDALEDKLVAVMERYVDTELGTVKNVLLEHKAAALDRLDRAIDGKKQEIEEVDRKARGGSGAPRVATRPGLPPLPMSFKGDVDKTTLATRELRAELASRLAPIAAATAPVAGFAPAAIPMSARAAAVPTPAAALVANPALLALAERMAKRSTEVNPGT